jgi:hypothetical protein
MVASPEYSEDKQAKFIPALCALHNFISVYDRDADIMYAGRHTQSGTGVVRPAATSAELPRPAWVSEEEESSASMRRDNIAAQMWADYQRYLTERETE